MSENKGNALRQDFALFVVCKNRVLIVIRLSNWLGPNRCVIWRSLIYVRPPKRVLGTMALPEKSGQVSEVFSTLFDVYLDGGSGALVIGF